MAEMTIEELRQRARRVSRVSLAQLPTPLEELPRLSEALGGPRILIKRDDCTGLALGGNKTRHNEFVLGLARQQGAEMLVWGAGVQSNNCRQTAAACARLGLACHLVLSTADHSTEVQGNLLLDYIFGATVEFTDVPLGAEFWNVVNRTADRFRARGRKVFSGADPAVRCAAAVSYVLSLAELVEQLGERGISADAIYVCSAGATGAGMFLGRALLGLACPIRSIMPLEWPWDNRAHLADTANRAAELLGCSTRLQSSDIDITADFIGAGYGRPTPGGMEATRLLARCEGILLDPVYTAKAMAALVADIRAGRLRRGQNVVFVHTGGTPALFAYHRELAGEFGPAA